MTDHHNSDDLALFEGIVDEALQSLLSSFDGQRVLDGLAALLGQHLGEHWLAVYLPEGMGRARMLMTSGLMGAQPRASLEMAGSGHEQAVASQRAVVVRSDSLTGSPCPEERRIASCGYTNLSYFPLIIGGRALGTLAMACRPQEGQGPRCFRVGERVAPLLAVALQSHRSFREVSPREPIPAARPIERIEDYVVESPSMRRVIDHVRLVASSDSTVLILGETGTGKEKLARLVHDLSPRARGPYVVVNITAIPESLVESELFGHEKGSFTGAVGQRIGRFEEAEGGTLFLDEVGDIPKTVQVKLLRALQQREIQRLGGRGTIPVNVRIVAATHQDLERLVEREDFRSDLYYRINIFPIAVPPLRERPEAIRPLAAHFVELYSARMGRSSPLVSDEVLRALEAHDWPGNVRELESFIQRALIFSQDGSLNLPEVPMAAPAARPEMRAAVRPQLPVDGRGRFDEQVREVLIRTMESTGGRIYGSGGAAELLGLKPSTLQGKLRKYGLKTSSFRAGR